MDSWFYNSDPSFATDLVHDPITGEWRWVQKAVSPALTLSPELIYTWPRPIEPQFLGGAFQTLFLGPLYCRTVPLEGTTFVLVDSQGRVVG